MKWLAGMLAATVVLCGCGGSRSIGPNEKQEIGMDVRTRAGFQERRQGPRKAKGVITGLVTVTGGTPSQADWDTVFITPVGSGRVGHPSSDGNYLISNVPRGTYTVQITSNANFIWDVTAQTGVVVSAGKSTTVSWSGTHP